jgi:serine/threonine protein kinase
MEICLDELTSNLPFELGINFKYLETIDHGAFGTVIHVIEISTNKDMAIKVINKSNSKPSVIKKVKEEISILKQLNHENIVKFFGFFETNNQLLIKMEYVKYGTLSKWIKNHKKITEEEASLILKQIFSAVVYLHGKQICHRDIKPENIMLSRENDLKSIKIIDFGLSAQHFDKLMNSDYCGTYIYMAPEQIKKKLYFTSVDIWSIGILMFMLLNNGNHPFYVKGDTRNKFNQKIENCKINFYNKISPMAKHLILKLLEPNPSWRYNAAQAYKHPWITRDKNDEVPVTFNEILHKSGMKKVGRNIFGIVIFLNYLTQKKKYFINEKYIKNCDFYDEKMKKKMIKRRETCLDILSTSEGDESDNENENSHDNLNDKKSEINNNFLINTPKKEEKIYSNQLEKKIIKKKILNFAKSTKNISSINNILNNTVRKPKLNFKKIEYKINLFANNFSNIESKNKKKINKVVKSHQVKLSLNPLYNFKKKEIINRNTNKIFEKEFKISSNSMSLKSQGDSKIFKFNNIYWENFPRKNLPDIQTPNSKKDKSNKKYSLNYSQHCFVAPLVLPSIKSDKKDKSLQAYIKKFMMQYDFRKRKDW